MAFKKCPNCGKAVVDTANYCTYCGAYMIETDNNITTYKENDCEIDKNSKTFIRLLNKKARKGEGTSGRGTLARCCERLVFPSQGRS